MEVQPTDFLKKANVHMPISALSLVTVHFLENYQQLPTKIELSEVVVAIEEDTGNISIVFYPEDLVKHSCWCRFIELEKRLMN